MQNTLNKLFDYGSLSKDEARILLRGIAHGEYNNTQIAALMSVYLMRNISLDELSGFREAIMEFSLPLDFGTHDYIDIVGTGGDGKDTFNISTCASFVVAGAGYKVVKHGNYGATSVSGASNVIESLGAKFSSDETILRRSLEECNIAYLHAPLFNSALKAMAQVRRDLGVRSFFNMLGPLINPSYPKHQLLGVFNFAMQRTYTYFFQNQNTNYAVVHSLDGYDEISLTSSYKVTTPALEKIYQPTDLGFTRAEQSELHSGGSIDGARDIFISVMQGTATAAQQNCVIANAAFAIATIDSSLSISQAKAKAEESIASGAAIEILNKFIKLNS